ncbi:hypothetical protein [Streptomyces avermitilis]|uniref:hypothetical protein n=1 Tax=Streptomyces avermitilis TaxID=33903 RepID=UPI003813B7B9
MAPKPLSAADTLLEAGEESAGLFLRRSPCRTAGPAYILIRTEVGGSAERGSALRRG